MPATPLWKLRRLAPRAVEVFERHRHRQPALAAYGPSLLPAAQELVELYDRQRASRGSCGVRNLERQVAAQELLVKVRAWVALLDKHMPTAAAPSFAERTVVVEDLVAGAWGLVRLVQEAPEPPPFAGALRDDLLPAAQAARLESEGARGVAGGHADLSADLGRAAAAFHGELVAFRRSLAVVIGRTHPDCRCLRAARRGGSEEGAEEARDEEAAPRQADRDPPSAATDLMLAAAATDGGSRRVST